MSAACSLRRLRAHPAQSPTLEVTAIFGLPALQQLVRLLGGSNPSAAEAAAGLLLCVCGGAGKGGQLGTAQRKLQVGTHSPAGPVFSARPALVWEPAAADRAPRWLPPV